MLISYEIMNRLSFTSFSLLGDGRFDELSLALFIQCRHVPLYDRGACLSNSLTTYSKMAEHKVRDLGKYCILPNTSLQTIYR